MRIILSFVFIFSFLGLSAQTEKPYLIRTELGYSYERVYELDPSVLPFEYRNETHNDLRLALSVGREFRSNFYYGLGVSYFSGKVEINPKGVVIASTGATTFSGSSLILTNKTFSPTIFIEGYKDITDKLVVAAGIYSKYNMHTRQTQSQMNTFDPSKNQSLEVNLNPSLRFNLVKNIGLNLTFSLVQYTFVPEYESGLGNRKNSKLDIGFDLDNWLLGFYIKL